MSATPIDTNKLGEKIVQVECGYKHVVARDSIGKVFS